MARFTIWPHALQRHVCVRTCTYIWHQLARQRTCTYIHVLILTFTHNRDVSCHICSKSLPPVLCRCPVSAREHSMYSYSAVFLPYLLESISHVCCLSCADVLCLLTSMAIIGYSGMATVLYCHTRPTAASGQPAVKRAGGYESGRPASKWARLRIGS